MNAAAVLALIGDLYAQITALSQRVAELEAAQTPPSDKER